MAAPDDSWVFGELDVQSRGQFTSDSIRVLNEMHMQSISDDCDVHKHPFAIKNAEVYGEAH